MIEQIISLVKEYSQESVINNPSVPNTQNNEVITEATNTITGGLQNMLAGGGLQDILSLFTGGNNNQATTQSTGISGLLKNPIVSMMVGHLVSKLVSKYNMNPAQASSISQSIIPNVLNGLVSRTTSNDPANDAFDFNDLIGALTGGNVATKESGGGFDFQGLLNQFTGGNNTNGGFDLTDLITQVTQGAQQRQEQQAQTGGIESLIRGFFN